MINKEAVTFIEYDWLYKLKLTDLKEGDYLLFEMEPIKGSIKVYETKILFEDKRPCISKKFHDKFFYSSRYIRVKKNVFI